MRRWWRRAAAAGVVVVVAVVAVVGVHAWRSSHRTDLQKALALAPKDAQRYSWTDWAAVRARLHAHVDASSSVSAVEGFLSKAYDADLSSSSTISDYAGYTQPHLGFSPANIDWELLAQSTQGAVVVIGASHVDFGRVRSDLERAGFKQTAGGVWDSSAVSNEVAAELITRAAGKRLATTVGRRVPVVGGVVGASTDAFVTWKIGRYVDREFLPRARR